MRSAYGTALRANRQENIWRLPGPGGQIEVGYLDAPADWHRYQGKSYSLIVVEEAGQFRSMKLLDLLRSTLRVPGMTCRMIMLANPGGRNHSVLHSRYIAGRRPWTPFLADDGEQWIWTPSTMRDNPHLNQTEYAKKLLASTGKDRELTRAWIDGDWNILRGAFFADVLDESKQMFSDPGFTMPDSRANGGIGADWGLSSPSVAYAFAWAMAPIGRYPRGSLILLDEVHSADPDDWTVGLQWSPGIFADRIVSMCNRTGVPRIGCIDDAKGLQGESLIQLLRQDPFHLYLRKPQKGRTDGWSKLRFLLANSKEGNSRPGLFVSEKCAGFWATMPTLPRDELHPSDVSTRGPDHWADAARYCATFEPITITNRHSTGY